MSLHIAQTAVLDGETSSTGCSEIEGLFQRLVQLVERSEAGDKTQVVKLTPECNGEVVCRLELGGAQYLIFRVQPQETDPVNLSPRELAIARLIAKGLPNKTIGTILEISPWTVATYLRRIFVKLEVTTRAAMIAKLADRHML
ncbi:MAG: helix-turn-helix transcriptional regulator [Chloroflexaceae bacterium]|nr:helix-turn-helix transcriptional regulator [Chloroflexaceae bacterium]